MSEQKKQVFVCMPTYDGTCRVAAAAAFYGHLTRQRDCVKRLYTCSSSLLANCFNILWSQALTETRRGERFDYFAMMHADVAPEHWWLDVMLAELESHQLDVVSAVIPIKDKRGLTSTAVGPIESTFNIDGRLTLREVFELPETFTVHDVPTADDDSALLINTGLWVCRWGDWAESVRFTINDQVDYDEERQQYMARCEPEDWNFSRQLARLGLRVGATRKVAIEHAGHMGFLNTSPWGDYDHDREHRDTTLLTGVLSNG